MTGKDAHELAAQLSIKWCCFFWICLVDGSHVIGRNLRHIRDHAKTYKARAIVLGKTKKGRFTKAAHEVKALATFSSKSNSAVKYYITRTAGGNISCSCPGWMFRQKCWHMSTFREEH